MPASVSSPACAVVSPRDRLLDAALELFGSRGYQATGLRELAGHVGLYAGSIYNHVESKQSLLFELIEGALCALLADTQRRLHGAHTYREHLQRFIGTFVAFNLQHDHRLQLVTRELMHLTAEQRAQVNELKDAYTAILTRIVQSGCAVSIRNDQAAQIANAVIAMLCGQLLWRDIEGSSEERTRALTLLVEGMIACARRP